MFMIKLSIEIIKARSIKPPALYKQTTQEEKLYIFFLVLS